MRGGEGVGGWSSGSTQYKSYSVSKTFEENPKAVHVHAEIENKKVRVEYNNIINMTKPATNNNCNYIMIIHYNCYLYCYNLLLLIMNNNNNGGYYCCYYYHNYI